MNATLRTHAFLTARLGHDPGIHLADIMLSRAGHLKSQLSLHAWLTQRVRDESGFGLNARSRGSDLIPYITADVFAEITTDEPLGAREAMAARAGVSKGTYVRFRARVFDPIKAAFIEYREKAAAMSRVVETSRSGDDAVIRYKYERAGNPYAPNGLVRGRDGETRPIFDHETD